MWPSYLNLRFLLLCFYAQSILLLSHFDLASCKINGNTTDHLALLDFKARITEDPFRIMSMWNDSIHFCQWYGVRCSRRHQRVTVLNLRGLQLAGSISPHVGNFSFLRNLSLLNNSFSYGIPPEIGRLRRLEGLRLNNNSFTGNIPANMSACSNLLHLNLAYNQFKGEIPEKIGALSNLQVLSLQKNSLSGNIPAALGNLSSLQILSAPENFLSGKIPDPLGLLHKLTFLSFSVNNLSGTIPPSIYNISSIETLNVVENHIEGALPSNLGITLPNLQIFAVAGNKFNGSIPSSLFNATNLVWLLMSENMLTGRVPSLELLNMLQVLSLGYNYLGNSSASGDLYFLSSLINSTNLWIVEITGNKFSGGLPESISNFSSATLSKFSMGDNEISGRIPPGISNLVNLETISMENNQLSGNIPIEIGKLLVLKFLYLYGNNLSGSIPFSLGNLTLLFRLYLGDNSLQGMIPQSLGDCKHLILLDLSQNNLSGSIPPQVIGLSSLSIFMDLSANRLTGAIPVEIGNLKNIEQLGISDNLLSGRVPASVGSCIKLEVLALQNNFLDGQVPSSLSSLRGIRVLDLSSNNLSGDIPEFLQAFDLLESLNLSYNNFEGVVPVQGIFSNASATLLMGNDKLCGGIPKFHLPRCKIMNPKRKMSLLLKILIPSVCASSVIAFVFILVVFCCLRKKRKEPTYDPHQNSILNVSYQSLLRATNGFSSANLIGTGSFAKVYKGILDERTEIAVKVLNLLHSRASNSFMAECEALKNIRHRNLVKLITACSGIDYEGNDFKALVYEYMVNGSLEEWLHPVPTTGQSDPLLRSLNLLQRLNIAIDVASALHYLHHQCITPIIHCDLKPSNVLLDNEMVGHIGDFGIAKILVENTSNISTSQSTSIGLQGTIGYAPPEYGIGRRLSIYGDVYSFGIMLLEMFTGKRPTHGMFKGDLNLHKLAAGLEFPDKLAEVADPALLQDTSERGMRLAYERIEECLFCIFKIGVGCSVEMPQERMKINDVVAELHSIRHKLIRH